MGKKKDAYNDVIGILANLKKEHPNYSIARNICTALEEYGDPTGVSNTELAFALEKYRSELEYHVVPDDELKQIIEEGENIDKLFKKGPFSELDEEEEPYEN